MMAVDQIARMMAMDAAEQGGTTDAYTKAETDALLDGKADLVDGKIPASELPSYVDDVLEYSSTAAFPVTGESGKIYVATDTNKTYRWGGSEYVEISESLALGETASTAYPGNKGKANADAIAAIKDGTNIDSFADVETALANIPQVTVDQTYSSSSTNPQSGVAVAQAISGKANSSDLATVATSGSYNDLTNTPTIPAAQVNADWNAVSGVAQILNKPTIPTVDQTYNAQSANAQSGTAVAQAIGNVPYTLKKVFSGDFNYTWSHTNTSDSQDFNFPNGINPFVDGKLYLVVIYHYYTSGYSDVARTCDSGFMVGASGGGGNVSFMITYNPGEWAYTFGKITFTYFNNFARVYWTLPARTDTSQSDAIFYGRVDAYEVSNILLNDGISATDYATQTTGGTVKAWTTTDGSDTILHLATQ